MFGPAESMTCGIEGSTGPKKQNCETVVAIHAPHYSREGLHTCRKNQQLAAAFEYCLKNVELVCCRRAHGLRQMWAALSAAYDRFPTLSLAVARISEAFDWCLLGFILQFCA